MKEGIGLCVCVREGKGEWREGSRPPFLKLKGPVMIDSTALLLFKKILVRH